MCQNRSLWAINRPASCSAWSWQESELLARRSLVRVLSFSDVEPVPVCDETTSVILSPRVVIRQLTAGALRRRTTWAGNRSVDAMTLKDDEFNAQQEEAESKTLTRAPEASRKFKVW